MFVKNIIRVGVALSALATLAVSAIAAGPGTGIWHGRVSFDTSKLPTPSDANQKKAMLDQIKAQQQVKITLTLKGDGTFSLVSTGGPKTAAPVSGTYTSTASAVTIQPIKAGKPQPPRTFNLSKDGHSMGFAQGPVSVSFSK